MFAWWFANGMTGEIRANIYISEVGVEEATRCNVCCQEAIVTRTITWHKLS